MRCHKAVLQTQDETWREMLFLDNYDDIELDTVEEFTYFGVLFSRTGVSLKRKRHTLKKQQRLCTIFKKGRLHNSNVKCQLKLFDKVVKPILLYRCEVWGMGNTFVIERVHLEFCKLLINLKKKSTPDFIIYHIIWGSWSIPIGYFYQFKNY